MGPETAPGRHQRVGHAPPKQLGEHASDPSFGDARITPEKLDQFKDALRAFAVELASGQGNWGDEEAVAVQLKKRKLTRATSSTPTRWRPDCRPEHIVAGATWYFRERSSIWPASMMVRSGRKCLLWMVLTVAYARAEGDRGARGPHSQVFSASATTAGILWRVGPIALAFGKLTKQRRPRGRAAPSCWAAVSVLGVRHARDHIGHQVHLKIRSYTTRSSVMLVMSVIVGPTFLVGPLNANRRLYVRGRMALSGALSAVFDGVSLRVGFGRCV
ncbi:hypothetical protein [Kibdelosporangium aridum]|uniref:Uncharacterized protein n=1 Tax=Kibdelosporangium aridum TaxID=2030 RepID=A0A1Y5YCJ9_KIBAR|nr:hypothetical protein [Kibdelosporangium aridum]SMD27072.1 hypothetical protein SAMN05661093_10669 [Kibdelosporangium aridum]